jgi:hypothetical protein
VYNPGNNGNSNNNYNYNYNNNQNGYEPQLSPLSAEAVPNVGVDGYGYVQAPAEYVPTAAE